MKPAIGRLAREWLPPRVRVWIERQFGEFRRVDEWPETVDGGWAAAAADAAAAFPRTLAQLTGGSSVGVAPGESLAALSETSRQLHERLVQFAAVVGGVTLRAPHPRILDFGGSFGAHAFVLKRLLPGLRFEYTVAELPGFCARGPSLNPHARFVPDLTVAGGDYDLVYASGSVQYSKDWRGLVADLCRATGDSLFITRMPVVFEGRPYIVVQGAYGTEYPGWVLNFRELVDDVRSHAFDLNEVFVGGRSIAARGAHAPAVSVGLLFTRTPVATAAPPVDRARPADPSNATP